MKQYMLIFSLGSVQTFIEQARKTRDLWLGSFLIAKLMEAAMKEVEQAQSEKPFVFPAKRTLNERYATLPHKYVAIFDRLADAQAAVEQSKRGMRKCWDTLRQDVWNGVIPKDYKNDETLKSIWDNQSNLDMCFETFWVIVEGDSDSYNTWLLHAEHALEARKRLKDFQFRKEPGEKSTISGEREALHGQLNDHQPIREQVKAFWARLAPTRSAKEISWDGSERLDALDTIKRFASESQIMSRVVEESEQIDHRQAFPSTSSIATATFVERLLTLDANQLDAWFKATDRLKDMQPRAIPYLEELAQKAGKNREILERDGDCFFKETFTARHIEKDHPEVKGDPAKLADKGRYGLSALLAATDKVPIRRPTPYYAIMKMDGDHMGDFLSKLDRVGHARISEELSSFARKTAPRLIEGEYPGRLVYAGGDDVLAFVPLARDLSKEEHKNDSTIHTLLDLVYRLRLQFGGIKEKLPDVPGPITASVGVAIAHHYTPLSAVLRASREAERLAKDRYDRNALVVTIMRRSGEQTRVGGHWNYGGLEQEAQPVPLFSEFYDLFDQDILSPKCIFTLLEEAPTLVSLMLESEEDKRAAQASEIKRVLRRQRDEKKKDRLSDNKTELLAIRLVRLATAMDKEMDEQHKNDEDFEKSPYLHEDKPRYGLVEVFGWLLVMAFLTRKEQD